MFGEGLMPVSKNWQELLKNDEQSFLTDNQLSVFVDKKKPGCKQTHFYPLPFPHQLVSGKWDFQELMNHDSLRSSGPWLDFNPDKTQFLFQPYVIEKKMRSGAARIIERCAVFENILLIEWNITGLDSVVMNFSLPYFKAKDERISNGILATIKGRAFMGFSIAGAAGLSFKTKEEPFECQADITIGRKRRKIYLAYSCGYNKKIVIDSVLSSLENPKNIFQRAEKTWNDYFTKIVPHFSCSDKMLEKLYYYQAYTTRANLYDIPYEPFTHPYTCSWKTGAVWQWSWNTPMNSIGERWLNDKAIGAGGILLEGANGGGLNIGTYLHPTVKHPKMRGHNENAQTIGRYLKNLPEEYDLVACTTIPHTTPNGLLGAWEFYLCSGDKDFLEEAFALMVEAESEFSKHELESGLCTCSFIDEFDYSLRWKPFINGFEKGDPAMMLKMDTPFIAIDYNCYLYSLREKIIEAAAIIGAKDFDVLKAEEKNKRLRLAINNYLWDETDGFYYDTDPRNMNRSGIKCISGIAAPLYSGIASRKQAVRLVEHLTDPKEFGTPYPCPSISMNTPEVDPSLLTYGGDSLITSGIWFTVEGLIRYGYSQLAANYIIKTIEMVTKEGPSSSYSYHSITGKYNQDKHTLASQCAILTDLICKYLIGLYPRGEGEFSVKPIALSSSNIERFVFGPYNYCGKSVTIRFDKKRGYHILLKEEGVE